VEDRYALEKQTAQDIRTRVLKLLVRHGVSVDQLNSEGVAPLHEAVRAGHQRIAEILLAADARIDAQDELGRTPLHWAICGEYYSEVRTVLERYRLDVRWSDSDQYEALEREIRQRFVLRMVEFLVSRGADIEAKDNRGRTALHYAASEGYDQAVEFFLAKGVDIDAKDEDGETPLCRALLGGHTAAARVLAARGAEKVDLSQKTDRLLVHPAVKKVDAVLVGLLLANGADADERDERAETPLHRAAQAGYKDVARALLDGGADIEARDDHGITALHYAARGHAGVTKLLLARGAHVNAIDRDGDTPLHDTAVRGEKEMAELLLLHGADVAAKDKAGRTPLDEALRNKHQDLAQCLRKHGSGRP